MVKKRKPGGGRKPDPYKKVMFSTRLEPHVMAAIRAGAETWPGKNVSTFVEALIVEALRQRESADRDPALRALLYLIAKLAERLSHGIHRRELRLPDGTIYRVPRNEWRNDPFAFQAFKFAVKQLLNALEEPPGDIVPPITEEACDYFGSSPELKAFLLDAYSSPEKAGALTFSQLWSLANRETPLSTKEREFMRQYPFINQMWMDEFYGLPQARRDLQLNKGD